MVDSLITLYESDVTSFNNNGLGNLNDASKCEVVEELNGAFELEMEYPITGIHYDDIKLERIICAKSNINGDINAFRIYSISKPIGGIIVINAEHISYDLSKQIINGFKADNSTDAIGYINLSAPIMPTGGIMPTFHISSNINIEKEMESKSPTSRRSLIAGNNNSFIETYGGEIEYGKNLTDLKQDENCSNVYTHVFPHYYYYNESKDGDGNTIVDERKITGYILPVINMFNFEDYLNAVKERYAQFDWSVDTNRYVIPLNKLHFMSDYGLWPIADENTLVEMAMLTRLDPEASSPQLRMVLYDSDDQPVSSTQSSSSTNWDRLSNYGSGCKIKMECNNIQDSSHNIYIKIPTVGVTGSNIKVYSYDASSAWNNTHEWSKDFPSKDELDDLAIQYINDNDLASPKVDLSVSFELLSQTVEYKDYRAYENVSLGDYVTVRFPQMGISSKSRCVKTTYNVLTNKYTSIDLGEGKTDFAYQMVETQKKAQQEIIENSDMLMDAYNRAGELITGNLGGYVVLHDSDRNGQPDEILIMNEPDIHSPTNKMWRWNNSGLAWFPNGYDRSPQGIAITNTGDIVADFITAGTMLASRIKGGTLQLGGLNNTSGTFSLIDNDGNEIIKMDKTGLYFYDENDNAVKVQILANGKIKAGEVDAENITGTTITGKTITGGTINGNDVLLGQANDAGGILVLYDGYNHPLVRLDHTGLYFYDSSGNAHLTEVTADGIKAGSVDAEDITGNTITGIDITGTNITGRSSITGATINGGTFHCENENDPTKYVNIGAGVLAIVGDGLECTGMARIDNGINMYNNNAGYITRYVNGGAAWTVAEYLAFWGGCIQAVGRLIGTEVQVAQPGTSTAGSNCRLTTLDAQGGGTAGLIWWAAGSSIKYKHDFTTDFDAELDPHNLYDLKVYQYKYKTTYIENEGDLRYDKNVVGFIAEQIDKHYPIAVDWYYDKEKKKRVVTDWNERYIIPPMLQLIQEQHEEIETLKKEISDLKDKVNEILQLLKQKG